MPDLNNVAAIGISVSSTCLCAATLDNSRNPVEKFEQAIESDSTVIDQIGSLVAKLSASSGVPVCVAVPGMIDSRSRRIVNSRISDFRDVDLSNSMSMPGLIVENDANAAAYADGSRRRSYGHWIVLADFAANET